MTIRPHVIVVGGSQAGVMAALALSSAGCDVEIFERSPSPLKDRGAGINLHRALVSLLDARARIAVDAISFPVGRQQYLGAGDAVLHSEPTHMTFSSWNALFGLLHRRLCATDYRLGTQVVGHDADGNRATVAFSDGSTAPADLVVFADGIASIGRELLAPGVEPVYAGYVVWRGCVAEADLPPTLLRHFDWAHTTCLVDHSHMNIYFVPAPSPHRRRGARMLNYVWYRNVEQGEALDELLIDRRGDRRSTSIPPGLVQQHLEDELRAAAIRDLPPVAAELVVKTREPFLQVIYDLQVDRMAFDRACLIGDAAFLARPHLGAGTAKAAENAWALADAIAAAEGDVRAALDLWEPDELALGRDLVARARRVGDRLQLEGSVVPGDRQHRADILAPLRREHVDRAAPRERTAR